MASVRATLSRQPRAIAVAIWATSSAWVSRVRWWSSGNTKTCVLPARRRNDDAWRMRSRSRSKQARRGRVGLLVALAPPCPGGPRGARGQPARLLTLPLLARAGGGDPDRPDAALV